MGYLSTSIEQEMDEIIEELDDITDIDDMIY